MGFVTIWWIAALIVVFLAGLVVGQQINARLVAEQAELINDQQRMIDERLEATTDTIAAIREFV